jgi:hypothetical protein
MLKDYRSSYTGCPACAGHDSERMSCTSENTRQFNTRFPSGLSSEKAGTSISKRSPLSLTIW